MAATWHVVQANIAYGNAKSMLDVFNGPTSARRLKCKRVYYLNNCPDSVSGVLTTVQVQRITAATGAIVIPPARFDPNTVNLDQATTAGTGRTTNATDVLRRVVWSNKNPVINMTATMDQWECLIPNGLIFEAGYYDSNVEPIVCNAGEGLQIKHTGVSVVGFADAEIEFLNV